MKIAIAAAFVAASALLTSETAVAHADPDYTWECDTDTYGHTSCKAVPIKHCAETADGGWVVVVPPGAPYPGIPAPCSRFGPGGTDLQAPYPVPPAPQFQPVPTHVQLPPGYRDGD